MEIIMVCTGNTCRSPMAEALLRRKIHSAGVADQIQVSSSGVAAYEQSPPSAQAVAVMADRGIDITCHRARQLREDLAAQADLLLTMTPSHKLQIVTAWPQYSGRTYTLHELLGSKGVVQDPYGGSAAEYEACARELENLIERIWPQLLERAGK